MAKKKQKQALIFDLYLERIRRGIVKPHEIMLEKFSPLVQKIIKEDPNYIIHFACRRQVQRMIEQIEGGDDGMGRAE